MKEQGLTFENPFNELLLNKKLSSNASQKSGQNGVVTAQITQQESRRVKVIQKFRVVREKILYLIGIPKKYATDEILRSPHFCGQYGTPERIVINQTAREAYEGQVSVYVHYKSPLNVAVALKVSFHFKNHLSIIQFFNP